MRRLGLNSISELLSGEGSYKIFDVIIFDLRYQNEMEESPAASGNENGEEAHASSAGYAYLGELRFRE
jgi:hypothetical protein